MAEKNRYDGTHLTLANNFEPNTGGRGTDYELERGVYVSLRSAERGLHAYQGISTAEARAAGEALIAIADEVEARVAREKAKPPYPVEPGGRAPVVKFDSFVPAYRNPATDRWQFVVGNGSDTYTWRQLCDYVGGDRNFTILYSEG